MTWTHPSPHRWKNNTGRFLIELRRKGGFVLVDHDPCCANKRTILQTMYDAKAEAERRASQLRIPGVA